MNFIYGSMALGALVLGAYSLTSEERDHVIDSVAHDISQTLLSQPQSLLQLPQQKSELIEQCTVLLDQYYEEFVAQSLQRHSQPPIINHKRILKKLRSTEQKQ